MHSLGRRELLKSAGLAACGLGVACATGGRRVFLEPPRRFARVRVAPERIIRTVVGLRPFRPSGFVVRPEKLDRLLVVHNYGHGGAGVTLSWGTAHLAVEEAVKTGARRYVVLGCGVVGLSTARLVQRRGHDVTIYTRDLPPATTSNIAGALWSPYSVSDADKRTPAFESQFVHAARYSHRVFQDLVGPEYGVRWLETYALSRSRPPGPPTDVVSSTSDAFHFDTRELNRHEHPFDSPHVERFTTMLIEPRVYLDALMRDFLLAGGKIVIQDFPDTRSIVALDAPVVVNCTGLGSRGLFGDQELIPAKGQLTVLLPQPEIDYAVLTDDNLYMFPRSDGILLGGTFERDDWSLDPNPTAAERILKGHSSLFAARG